MSEKLYNRPPTALLVLGAAVWADGPSPTLRRRTAEAARLWHAGAADVVLASGGTGRHPPSEAETIETLLREAGVPSDRIRREDRSRTTLENIAFCKPILEELGISRVILVTDRTHALRARMTAHAFGLAAEVRSPPLRSGRWRTILQQALRESLAVPVYARRLRALRRGRTGHPRPD